MDEGVNQGGDLALDDEVASRLEVRDDLSQASAELTRDQDDVAMYENHDIAIAMSSSSRADTDSVLAGGI